MPTYLALARLTVGADKKTHRRELLEGMDRLVEEMHEYGMSDNDIGDAFRDACAQMEVEPD
jgi:hypothetical protein